MIYTYFKWKFKKKRKSGRDAKLFCYFILTLLFIIIIFYNFDYKLSFYFISFPIKPLNFYKDLTIAYKGSDPILKKDLHKVGGVYGIVYKSKEGKSMQYIGSSLNLYLE